MSSTYFTTQFVGSTAPVATGLSASANAPLLAKFVQEVQHLLTPTATFPSAADAILEMMQRYSKGRLVGLYRWKADGEITAEYRRGTVTEDESAEQELQRVIRHCLQRMSPYGAQLKGTEPLMVLAAPLRGSGSEPWAIVHGGSLDDVDMPTVAGLVEATAAALSPLLTRDHLLRLEWESQVAAATCELISAIQGSQSHAHALMLTANELKQFFQCQQVSVAMARRNRPGVELQSVSGLSEFDRSATPIRLLSAALDEVAVRDELTLWPPGDGQRRHATLALRKLAEANRADALIGIPLRNGDQEVIGTIVAEGVRMVIHEPRQLAAWQAMAPAVALALIARRKAERHLADFLTPSLDQRRRRRMILLIAAILAALAALPVPHRLRTDCQVEPVVRRFVVAPYDGRLQVCHVEPGDLVTAGQVLAEMDDRELGFELASLSAERFRAAKERDTATADHDTSAAQMAALEMERLDARIDLLRERMKNLAIVSPLDGVVLKGELQDAEGAPVKVGQALLEVAPLDPIELELAIAANDFAWSRPNLPVVARLDGYADGPIEGVVRTIHPRAEIRDAKNIFVARVTLTNPHQKLRPGMGGRAWIRAGYRPLAWIWLHKAVHRLRVMTGW